MSIQPLVTSLLIPVLLLTGCASSTLIRSTDPQAKIYVDGEYKGTGSASH